MSNKQKSPIRLEHRNFGWGTVIAARMTDTARVFDIRFDDGRDRACLALPEFWLTSASELERAFIEAPIPKVKTSPSAKVKSGSRRKKDAALPGWRHTFEFAGVEDEFAELVPE